MDVPLTRKPKVDVDMSKREMDDVTDILCSLFPSPTYVPMFDEPLPPTDEEANPFIILGVDEHFISSTGNTCKCIGVFLTAPTLDVYLAIDVHYNSNQQVYQNRFHNTIVP